MKKKGYKLLDKFNLPMIKGEFKEDHYEFEIPIKFFEGCQVHDKETGEFLGWVDGNKKAIIKYEVKEKEDLT